jgi:hypothetical protein
MTSYIECRRRGDQTTKTTMMMMMMMMIKWAANRFDVTMTISFQCFISRKTPTCRLVNYASAQ